MAADFTFTGPGSVVGTGVLIGVQQAGNPGVYNVTGGYGTFNDGSGSVSLSLVINPIPGNVSYSPTGGFIYDNVVTPAAGPGLILDYWGLLFAEAHSGELNLYANNLPVGGPVTDISYEEGRNGTLVASGTFSMTGFTLPVPEPSMAFLLIPALGFVGVIRKKFMA